MKNIFVRMLSIILALTMLACCVSCNNNEENTETDTENITESESEIPGSEIVETEENLRVIIASDVHHCWNQQKDRGDWYMTTSSIRMQWWVNSVNAEHEKKPIDLLIIAGDLSLDYYSDRGSYTEYGKSMTKEFMEKYVSQIPEEIPVFVMPGNHEAYTDAKWFEITGQHRQQSYALKDNLFLMLDNYGSEVGSKYDGDAACTQTDVKFIKDQMAANPDCNKVWLIAHYFDMENESNEFKSLLKENAKIKGLFSGHSHSNTVINTGLECGNKRIAKTGNYSYSWTLADSEATEADIYDSFWGFRELIISNETAMSNYIIAQTKGPIVNGKSINLNRKLVHSVRFY